MAYPIFRQPNIGICQKKHQRKPKWCWTVNLPRATIRSFSQETVMSTASSPPSDPDWPRLKAWEYAFKARFMLWCWIIKLPRADCFRSPEVEWSSKQTQVRTSPAPIGKMRSWPNINEGGQYSGPQEFPKYGFAWKHGARYCAIIFPIKKLPFAGSIPQFQTSTNCLLYVNII